LLELAGLLLHGIVEMGRLLTAFQRGAVTPSTTYAFENALRDQLRQVGREIVSWVYNHLEPSTVHDMPAQLGVEAEWYRRRPKSPRNRLATLFGSIVLWRYLYEPLATAERSIFPLEMRLGVVAGLATPALAARVGHWSADHTQSGVVANLQREHGIRWGTSSLRKVTAAVSAGLAEQRHAVQVAQVVAWLHQARASKGRHRPVLSVGRDGIFLPLRDDEEYREGATATVSVLDRRGRRLGTVYLGCMPEPGQGTLSQQLTQLLKAVLQQAGPDLPRLEYVTDGGYHPTRYYEEVLQQMVDPRQPPRRLNWIWVIDFYHACLYLTKLAEALFGELNRGAQAWSHKMRQWLRDKPRGLGRVLHSAAALHARWELSAAEEKTYAKAYAYLSKRRQFMDYAGYRKQGLAMGSGITEAACKTVFSQRLKLSGMKWQGEGGQVILDLRVLRLSGVWDQAHRAYLAARERPEVATIGVMGRAEAQKVA